MNPSQKLFIAATLVAGGYGLAALLGTPSYPSAAHYDVSLARSGGVAAPWTGESGVVGSMRLLPSVSASAVVRNNAAPASPPQPSTTNARDPAGGLSSQRQQLPWRAPQARLSDVKLPSAATSSVTALPDETRNRITAAPTAFGDEAQAQTTKAIRASANMSETVAAPPSELVPIAQATDDPPAVTIHVVIDGDSLARLATRYLDDPRRADEIYRLNDDVLRSPDLLPIGAELKIPVRGTSADVAASESGDGAAPESGLVPIAPTRASSVATPRAQLLRPLPAG